MWTTADAERAWLMVAARGRRKSVRGGGTGLMDIVKRMKCSRGGQEIIE